jgi:hypothetical protein
MALVRINRGIGTLVGALAALLLVPAFAGAATISVNSTADPTATPSDCTLHDAITAANTNAVVAGSSCTAGSAIGTDTIDFSLSNPSTITLAGALPNITTNVDVSGPGSSQLTVSGNDLVRPFSFPNGTTDSIEGLTITHGSATFAAGIFNAATLTLTDVAVSNGTAAVTGGTDAFGEAGGIHNGGTLHLVLSSVTGNTASSSGASNQNAPAGGGIWSSGTLSLDRSTVSGNTATANALMGNTTNAVGGGIDVAGGTATITQSTISGNSVTATGAVTANTSNGGGIVMANTLSDSLTLDRTTITGNSASSSGTSAAATGGGINAQGASFSMTSSTLASNSSAFFSNLQAAAVTRTIKNSIISTPLGGGANCSATSTSLGFNLESANTCGFNQATDKPNTDPLLAGLSPNGGPTQTMALPPGSPAIDAGHSSTGETADQRNLTRPVDRCATANAPGSDGTDIGAFELQETAPTSASQTPMSLIFGSQQTDAGATAPQTVTLSNNGVGCVHVASISLTGANASEFATSNDTCTGAALGPAASCTLDVAFDPSSAGGKAATLSFTDDAPTSPQQVTLSGTGLTPPPPAGGGNAPPVTSPPSTSPTKKKCRKGRVRRHGKCVKKTPKH